MVFDWNVLEISVNRSLDMKKNICSIKEIGQRTASWSLSTEWVEIRIREIVIEDGFLI